MRLGAEGMEEIIKESKKEQKYEEEDGGRLYKKKGAREERVGKNRDMKRIITIRGEKEEPVKKTEMR